MNEIRNTKCESRVTGREARFGFTLVELVVAIGIMAMVIVFAGVVFKTSIASYRVASAQAEIMQKFRAITDQLNNDFRGIRKDAPLFIWFQSDPNDPNKRLDQIMFFADGDFQSIQTYYLGSSGTYAGYIIPQSSGAPVISNLARIYYGQAQSLDPNYNNNLNYPWNMQPYNRVLSRRQHLSIANPDSGSQYWHFPAYDSSGNIVISPALNDWLEHDTNSLSQWQTTVQSSTNVNNIITGCFGTDVYYGNNRPVIKVTDANTLQLLLTQNVGSFSVQWSYAYSPSSAIVNYYWWPSIDPAGSGSVTDSDFAKMPVSSFGFYFNMVSPLSPATSYWFSSGGAAGKYYPGSTGNLVTEKPAFPKALKFTFTLYDSINVFKNGQTFTHIVYIGD